MSRGHLGSSPQLHAVSCFLATISRQAGADRDLFVFRKEMADVLVLTTNMRMTSLVSLGPRSFPGKELDHRLDVELQRNL